MRKAASELVASRPIAVDPITLIGQAGVQPPNGGVLVLHDPIFPRTVGVPTGIRTPVTGVKGQRPMFQKQIVGRATDFSLYSVFTPSQTDVHFERRSA
jgi:hypothetical protein